MFQAKVKDVIVFKKIIDSLSSLVNEVNLEATSTVYLYKQWTVLMFL